MSRAASVQVPGSDRIRELAQAALSLAGEIRSVHVALRASDVEFVRRVGFRLVEAAGQAVSIEGELEETARDLDRYLSRPADACEIPWGVCPEHGNTLTSTASRTTCAKCRRAWGYDRITLPCEEPARWLLADAQGASSRVCDGHATDARARLDHARLTPLGTSDGGIS
jgi:hypothetical protein